MGAKLWSVVSIAVVCVAAVYAVVHTLRTPKTAEVQQRQAAEHPGPQVDAPHQAADSQPAVKQPPVLQSKQTEKEFPPALNVPDEPAQPATDRAPLLDACYRELLSDATMRAMQRGFAGTGYEIEESIERQLGPALKDILGSMTTDELLLYRDEQKRLLRQKSPVVWPKPWLRDHREFRR